MFTKLSLLFPLLAACALAQARVYELRTYTCSEGKLEALKGNFRDDYIELLKRHGMESIGYWVPQDPQLAKNTLIYILVHPSRAAADKNWAEFRKDPDFIRAVTESEKKNGKVVQKIDSMFLDPADFSALK